MTDAAIWLDTTFAGFDHAILQAMHGLAEWGGWFLTPVFTALSYIGDLGMIELALAVVLLFFKKTRMAGACMIVAVGLGALMTNLILKDLIARPRPYADADGPFYEWWQNVGSHVESDNSFPSGHVTAAMASMTALFLTTHKRISWVGFVFVAVMMLDRCYLMVHYPTDVIAGLLVGALAGILAFLIVRAIFMRIEKRREPIPDRG